MVELRLPGPTELPPQVIRAMGKKKWLMNHRGPEFKKLLEGVTGNLKEIFQTKNDILIFPGSGTLGMEASVVSLCGIQEKNLLLPLFLSNGHFGGTFIEIARGLRIMHDALISASDKAILIDKYEQQLLRVGKNYYGALYFVHNESSNGLTNDAEVITRIAREHNPNIIIIMDAISSMGGINIPTDKWGIDIVITASQKALMAPPGIVAVSVSDRAKERIGKVQHLGFYGNIKRYLEYMDKGQTPSTPCLPVIGALELSTRMILKEGLKNVFARHQKISSYVKEGLRDIGFVVLGDERSSSLTITAASLPDDLRLSCTSKKFVELLKEQGNLEIASGAHDKGEYIRIGHMGYITEAGAERIIRKIKKLVAELRQKSA